MDEDVYVQSVGFKLKMPDGETKFAKFIGLAFCSPEEWEQILSSNTSLADLLQDGQSILFQKPIPIEDAIADQKQYNDIIDMVREELRKEHHENLKENQDTE